MIDTVITGAGGLLGSNLALGFAEKGGLVEARRREISELERRQQRALSDAPPAGEMWLDTKIDSGFGRTNGAGVLDWLVRQLFH